MELGSFDGGKEDSGVGFVEISLLTLLEACWASLDNTTGICQSVIYGILLTVNWRLINWVKFNIP